MGKKKLKDAGDDRLMALIARLQDSIARTRMLQQTAIDDSDENIIAQKILEAKYNFLFREAKRRKTSSKGMNNVVSH